MGEWLAGLGSVETIFFYCAAIFGGLFVLQLILRLVGVGGHDIDFDSDIASADVDVMTLDHAADSSFGFLSVQGVLAFFMMFGLVGLMVMRDFGGGETIAILCATAAGIGAMFLIQFMFNTMQRLQSSGTLDSQNAVGVEGRAYLTIPVGGTGKVQVTIQGRLQEFDATSNKPFEIRTGDRIRVVEARGATLVVERVV